MSLGQPGVHGRARARVCGRSRAHGCGCVRVYVRERVCVGAAERVSMLARVSLGHICRYSFAAGAAGGAGATVFASGQYNDRLQRKHTEANPTACICTAWESHRESHRSKAPRQHQSTSQRESTKGKAQKNERMNDSTKPTETMLECKPSCNTKQKQAHTGHRPTGKPSNKNTILAQKHKILCYNANHASKHRSKQGIEAKQATASNKNFSLPCKKLCYSANHPEP